MTLILSANGCCILKWWVDASFAVHPNMRGHSGGGLSLGRGFPIVSSTNQKLNTRSSTETEIVGADDFMPAICWTLDFIKAQGYDVKDNILFQDNKSSILLEKNGKASSSKRTKHINILYFFITDRFRNEKVLVVWCPKGDMIGDYATKPLQGVLFRKFRDQIMGVTPARDPIPGKTEGGVSKTETKKIKPKKGKVIRLVAQCVGSRTWDRAKAGPGLMRKIADLTIFNQSKGKSGSYAHAAGVGIEDPTIFNQSNGKRGSYAHAARVRMQNHSKGKSLLHLTSLK
jgi:hypothetical protein